MNCPHCGRDTDPLFKFCLHCGKELKKSPAAVEKKKPRKVAPAPQELAPAEETQPCPQCAIPVRVKDRFCPECGYNLKQPEPSAETPDYAKPILHNEETDRQVVGSIISVSSVDGRETVRVPLYAGENTLGRGEVDVQFAEDDRLSPLHLTVTYEDDELTLVCPGSRNGSFVRMHEPAFLAHGDQFRIGQQLLRYEDLDLLDDVTVAVEEGTQMLGSPTRSNPWGRLTQVISEEETGSSFLLSGEKVFLGRERGNITFPGDRYISGTHAVVGLKPEGTVLEDVGSSNGTYLKIKGECPLRPGQYFLAGRQLFKIDLKG